jgi:hypothetical protein
MMTVVPAWKILEALEDAMRNEETPDSNGVMD